MDTDPTPWSATGPDDDLPDLPVRPMRDADDLLEVMIDVVGPERAGPPALWFALLDADRTVLPVVLPLVGIPLRPDPSDMRQVMVAMADVLSHDAPGGSLVAAVVRAAGGDLGSWERAWLDALLTAAADQGVPVGAVLAIGEHRARVVHRSPATSW